MATEIRHPAIAELTQDGDTFDLSDYCRHCGESIFEDDAAPGTFVHLRRNPEDMRPDYRYCAPRLVVLAYDDPVWRNMRLAEPDTRTLRLRIEPDQHSSVMDDGFYGEMAFVEWYRSGSMIHHRRTNDYGYYERPDGFDGRAHKLTGRNFDDVWWQPPADLDADGIEAMRKSLLDLLEYGYCGLIVELLDGEDAYHRPIVVNAASLWGIEPFPDGGYVAEVVGELVAEVLG